MPEIPGTEGLTVGLLNIISLHISLFALNMAWIAAYYTRLLRKNITAEQAGHKLVGWIIISIVGWMAYWLGRII